MTSKSANQIQKDFWKALFQNGRLSHRMEEIQASENGVVVQLPGYGDVLVSVKRAAPVGANFMSDVYSVTATVAHDSYKAFVKVQMLYYQFKIFILLLLISLGSCFKSCQSNSSIYW